MEMKLAIWSGEWLRLRGFNERVAGTDRKCVSRLKRFSQMSWKKPFPCNFLKSSP